MRLTMFILGILVVGLFITVFAIAMSEIALDSEYNVDSANFSSYEKIEKLNNNSQKIRDRIKDVQADRNAFDIVGQLFGGAYDSVEITYDSFEVGIDMADDAFGGVNDSGVPLGNAGGVFSVFLVTAIVFILFVGIVLAILLKWRT